MQDDVSKRSFVRQLTDHEESSGHAVGPDGRKIAYSQENLVENDLLDSYKERFFMEKFGNGQYQYWLIEKRYGQTIEMLKKW